MGQPDSSHDRIPALDGVRGIAVLWVMIYHFTFQHTDKKLVFDLVYRTFRYGDKGVDIFFVLSGFLITGILLKTKDRATGLGHYFKTFYWRRTLRIFPLYYITLAVMLLIVPWFIVHDEKVTKLLHDQWMLWGYMGNFGMTFGPVDRFDAGPIRLLHFWSLAIEEQFYIVWPFVVWFCSRRMLVAACGVAAALSLTSWLVLTKQDLSHAPWYFTLTRTDSMCAGAAMATLLPSIRENAKYRKIIATIAIIGVGLLATIVMFDKHEWIQGWSTPQLIRHWGINYTIALGLACAIGWLSTGRSKILGKVIGNPFFTFFGKYSYGLYVWHYTIVLFFVFRYTTLSKIANTLTVPGALLFNIIVGIGVSVILAMASFHLIENHFLKIKDRVK